ncbi:MAG: oxygenase MpaB family protein [Actinomycetota bacterium]|jgi:uncharacterized protein (DUF2236 family)|nr:oxygenase MpaB family protein [Actinomycetota bacterium]
MVTLDPLAPVRAALAAPLRRALGEADLDIEDVPGDPGLFGPGSVTWRVHADTPAMLVGGVSSLLLQALHPGAMAGVADHSAYEDDPDGRLRRTGTFVAGTTFGSTATAERLIGIVRSVHRSVVGVRPDGLPYDASDPALLRWVHVAEHAQFARAYQCFGGRPLRSDELDRYFAEVAEVARRLGADDVPASAAEVEDYLTSMRPELVAGDQAMGAVRFVLTPRSSRPADRAGYLAFTRASVSILPDWAARMLGVRQPWPELAVARTVAFGLCRALRWSLGPSPVVDAARRRAAAPPPGR